MEVSDDRTRSLRYCLPSLNIVGSSKSKMTRSRPTFFSHAATRKIQTALTLILLEALYFLAAHGDFNCLDGWTLNPENGQCYYISEQYASYDVAEMSCKDMSSSLTSIHSQDEHTFILPLLYLQRSSCSAFDQCTEYWIGLRKDGRRWVWGDGSSVSDDVSFWGEGFPKDSHVHQCGLMEINDHSHNLSGYWKNENCKKTLSYVCKKVSDCPAGFFRVAGVNHCYKLNLRLSSWDNASTTCRTLHPRSTLAIITTQAETNAVTKFLKIEFSKNGSHCIVDVIHGKNVWIGGQRTGDKCSSPYVWKPAQNMELPMRYTNWYYTQPDCMAQRELCIHISQMWGYQWNDEYCPSQRCSLCQASF